MSPTRQFVSLGQKISRAKIFVIIYYFMLPKYSMFSNGQISKMGLRQKVRLYHNILYICRVYCGINGLFCRNPIFEIWPFENMEYLGNMAYEGVFFFNVTFQLFLVQSY